MSPAMARRVLVEVRTCGACGREVIYWEGRFRHLDDACPADWRITLSRMTEGKRQ